MLINQQCRVKICDFGLARSLNHVYEDPQHPALTEYVGKFIAVDKAPRVSDFVATRWYRAPEILLASSKYVVVSEAHDGGHMTVDLDTPKVLTCGQLGAFSEKFYSASHSSKERRPSISWSVSFSTFQHRATRI